MATVLPSLLAADFSDLRRDMRRMETAGAEVLHLDVMDGHFVPNLSFGIPVIRSVRQATSLTLDVHLMISNAESTFEEYIDAGADWLSVHYEAVTHLERLLSAIRAKGAKPGVVLNPHTPLQMLDEILSECHHVLLMSVNPGFGGQKLIRSSLAKAAQLREMIQTRGLDVKIEMDGGIGLSNTEQVVESGVEFLVAGSAIFATDDPVRTFREMKRIASAVGVD
jgi:ribulose-phosphate 3-epimerase